MYTVLVVFFRKKQKKIGEFFGVHYSLVIRIIAKNSKT